MCSEPRHYPCSAAWKVVHHGAQLKQQQGPDHTGSFTQGHVEQALVRAGLVTPGFFNSWALNLYHDGSEGIQSHFDDPDRFEQPIYSLRLFSDSRLSFGTQLYGYAAVPQLCILSLS